MPKPRTSLYASLWSSSKNSKLLKEKQERISGATVQGTFQEGREWESVESVEDSSKGRVFLFQKSEDPPQPLGNMTHTTENGLWPRVGMERGFPGGASGKEHACQCRRCKRHGFYPKVGNIPWWRAWQLTPASLPGESHGQKSLVDYGPWGYKESDMTKTTQHVHVQGLKVTA